MIGFDALLRELSVSYGDQSSWWPAEDAFEVMVGALLVQRTSWQNAATAIGELRGRGLLDPCELRVRELAEIETAIRAAGFFRLKSSRLQELAGLVQSHGGIDGLASMTTSDLRETLLTVTGVGAETADAMLLYAFGRPVVVVDEYLRRLEYRLRGRDGRLPDEALRELVSTELGQSRQLSELHALVVTHGQRSCRKTPACAGCCIADRCVFGRKLLAGRSPGSNDASIRMRG